MATNAFVEIDIPEAQDLADLTGINIDLQMARNFASRLKEMLEKEPPDCSLVEPMTIAILIKYNRPFMSGVRLKLKEDTLKTLSPFQKAAHGQFYSWRNKHIAHSVNEFEENQPIARYWVERFDDEGFSSVECNSNQIIGMNLHDVEMVIELTSHFINELKSRIKKEKEKVLAIVRSRPKEQIFAMGKPVQAVQAKDVGNKRKK